MLVRHFEKTIETKLNKGMKKVYDMIIEYINETLDIRDKNNKSMQSQCKCDKVMDLVKEYVDMKVRTVNTTNN